MSEKIMSKKAEYALRGAIEKKEKEYLKAVKMVAHYGADQDGWHGEAYAMHYHDQLKVQDELMRLKKIQNDCHIVEVENQRERVKIGNIVRLKIDDKKIKEFLVDGFQFGSEIQVISPESPIGKAIMNKEVGNIVGYETIDKKIKVEIIKILLLEDLLR